MACTQILVYGFKGGPEWGMLCCHAMSVAQTTPSKERMDKIDKFPDKNFHASVILWFAKNQAVMNTAVSSW